KESGTAEMIEKAGITPKENKKSSHSNGKDKEVAVNVVQPKKSSIKEKEMPGVSPLERRRNKAASETRKRKSSSAANRRSVTFLIESSDDDDENVKRVEKKRDSRMEMKEKPDPYESLNEFGLEEESADEDDDEESTVSESA
ncbi:hypothetical protein PENTCL1PPCAC_14983, partial [Pristionchus entomophagus]